MPPLELLFVYRLKTPPGQGGVSCDNILFLFKLLCCGRVFNSFYPWFFALKPQKKEALHKSAPFLPLSTFALIGAGLAHCPEARPFGLTCRTPPNNRWAGVQRLPLVYSITLVGAFCEPADACACAAS